ncbi:flagellin Hag [Bacillus sp. DTU_2020_1000418_1_SI_GHA_SEK_038]|uniref:flagellin Hag n=1 Tax=Bacillus sp. DTU_2020_1000418_1_SI_GHA_SEK_038 TaxID=3077585 RepID=UPI0028EC9B80|nr:flagellin Hag [Bacillus sp. DTU_2020_1000418_1_SI_GHA_SEK_038]WNS75085.1 flagellin Hag [Bacillus sp. DTU_2020_1000418_1_SI_GHA_SEK_038]
MIINHNLNAMNSHRQMGMNINSAGKSMEKLSSGLRINRAGDDAAGLSISEKMRGQIRGLDQASRNSQDAISLIQTAEGALNEQHAILQRMRELVVQGGNGGTLEADDIAAINAEITQLNDELTGISTRTEFNGKKLINGSFDKDFQIGANKTQQLNLKLDKNLSAAGDLATSAVAVDGTKAKHDTDIDAVDTAIKLVSTTRSTLGSYQNRLEHTIKNLDNAAENLQAAESRIRDVDMAKEMMNFTKNNILNQASQAMLAQANQQPQAVLQLLR